MDERVRFVARLLDGEKMATLCREFAISRKTGYKIFDRYKECGPCCCVCSAGCSSQSTRFLARPVSSALTYCFPNGDLAYSCWKPK